MPRVSVVMSNYNTPPQYLHESIKSILSQTYRDFEFIIIDDGSTDGSVEVIKSFLSDDRIKLVENKTNLGLPASLNIGFGMAQGEYIARMDSDDISYPDRIEKQVRFMDEHPEIIVSGTWCRLFGEREGEIKRETKSWEEFRINMLFGNNPGLAHMTTIFRRHMLDENGIRYNEHFRYAQDYRMWVDCMQVAPLGILSEILMSVRVNAKGISVAKKNEQDAYAREVVKDQLCNLGIIPDEEEFSMHYYMLNQRTPLNAELRSWIKRLIRQNRKLRIYDGRLFRKMVLENWRLRVKSAFSKSNSIFTKLLLAISFLHWNLFFLNGGRHA